jgi:hypothetical protein
MKLRIAEKLSDEFLWKAYLRAAVPVKRLGPYTIEIFDAVATLKAAEALGKQGRSGWERLRSILDRATEAGDFSAYGDFSKAWATLKVSCANLRIAGEDFPCATGFKNAPRSRITAAIVFAIGCLQDTLDRAPTRQEILHFMSTSEAMVDPVSIDDTEMSAQLRKLGIQELIPTAADLGS